MPQFSYDVSQLASGAHHATGVVNPVTQWVGEGEPRQPKVDDQGRQVFALECIRQMEVFDALRTQVYNVELPLASTGEVPAGGVVFEGLSLTVRYSQKAGLQEFWSARSWRPAAQGKQRAEQA